MQMLICFVLYLILLYISFISVIFIISDVKSIRVYCACVISIIFVCHSESMLEYDRNNFFYIFKTFECNI